MSDLYSLTKRKYDEPLGNREIQVQPLSGEGGKTIPQKELVAAPQEPTAADTYISTIREGVESDIAKILAESENPEEELQKWQAATIYGREFGLSTFEAYSAVDTIAANYFTAPVPYKTLPRAFADSFKAASLSLELGKTMSKYMGGPSVSNIIGAITGKGQTEGERAELKAHADDLIKQMSELSIDRIPKWWLRDGIKMIGSVLPYTADVVIAGAVATGATAITGGAAGVAGAAWFRTLQGAISAGVRFSEAYEINRGLNFIDMVSRGIPEKDAMKWSSIAAAGSSAIESLISLEAGISGAITSGAAKSLTEGVITKLGASGLLTSTASKFIGRMTLNTISEMLEEGSQSVIDGIATIIAQEAQEQGVVFDPLSGRDVVRDMAESAWAAAVTSPFLGLPSSVALAIKDHKAAIEVAGMARHMGKSEFEEMAANHPALEAIGVSEEERKKQAGKIWETQAEAAAEEAREAAAATKEAARSGRAMGEEAPDLPAEALFIQADARSGRDAEGNRPVTYLVGTTKGSRRGETIAQVETLVSDNSVIITGGMVEGEAVQLTGDMISGIAARNPGKEIKLGTGVEDAALQGGFERFMEQGGPQVSKDISIEDAIEEERLVSEIEKASHLDRPKTRVAVELMRALNTAVNGRDAPLHTFTQYLSFKGSTPLESQKSRIKTYGVYSRNRDIVTGAVDLSSSLISLAKGVSDVDTLDTFNHEVFHYFRQYLSSMAPDNPGLKAVEAEYGITNGQWSIAEDERFVAEARAWQAKRKSASEAEASGEKVGLFERFADFFRALYKAIVTELSPAVAKAMDEWFGSYDGTDPGAIEVPESKVGAYNEHEHPAITKARTLEEKRKPYIAAASKRSGKPESYYRETAKRLEPYLGRITYRFSRAGAKGKMRTALVNSGAWIANPQLVAEIKHWVGLPLEKEERELLSFSTSGLLHMGDLGPSELFSIKSVQDLEGGIKGEAFKKWFGDSKVVDAEGKPLVVYHGTTVKDIEIFKASDNRVEGNGIYFSSSQEVAESYSGKGRSATVMPVYLSFQSPLIVDANGGDWSNLSEAKILAADGSETPWTVSQLFGYVNSFTDRLAAKVRGGSSFDGIIIKNVKDQGPRVKKALASSTVYIAIEPTQIKSVNNRGTWSASDPSILRSVREVASDDKTLDAYLDSSTMLYSVREFDEERPRPEVQYETEAKEYKSFDSWLASMYADTSLLSERDLEWLRMIYDNAHKAGEKRFKNKGDFARFLGAGREFYDFIFNLGRVINSQDRLSDEAEATRARRLERAIAQTPELKNLVDRLYETGEAPTASQTKAALAEIRRNESLYKYAYAVLQSDQELAFEAISELDEVPLLARRDLLGSTELSIAEQAAIIEALKDARLSAEAESLGEKIKNGTITIEEMREYVKLVDEAHEKELAEEKAKVGEAEKKGRAEERAKGREKVKEAHAEERAKLAAYKRRQKERAAARKMLKEMERLERFIFTRPSSRVDYEIASLIMGMQEALAAGKPIDRSKLSMLESFNAKYNEEWRETLDSFINVVNAAAEANKGSLPLEIVKLTADLFDSFLIEGRRSLKEKQGLWGSNVKGIRADIVAEFMAGKYWKPDMFGESRESVKRKKRLDKIAIEFDALRPDAFFRKYLGKRATALLFDESVRARSAKYRNYDRRTAMVTNYIAKERLMKNDKLNREMVLEGVYSGGPITITGRELLGIRLLLGTETDFNQKQRKALIYGNFFTSEEKNADGTIPGSVESANSYMADRYDEKVKALLDFVKDNLTAEEETLARLMLASTDNERDWHRFASAVIFLTNKEPHKEKFYFPIIRDGDFGIEEDKILQELKSYGIEPGLDNAMALERADIQPRDHKRVKLDAISTFYSAISKQEHLTEVGPYAKRLAGVFKHGELSQSARTMIRESLGQKALDYIDNQIQTIVNPVQYDAKASGGELLRFFRGSQVVANLAFRWTSAAMQMLTSPLPGIAEAPLELLGSSVTAWTNPIGFVNAAEEKSAILKNRQLDPQHAELLKRKELGVASAFDKLSILGMSPISWADRFSVAIVWDAVYRKHLAELEKNGNPDGGSKEARAIEYADRFTLKTQPTSDIAERAPMYRDMNTFKALVLQFTQPLNVIYNNIRMDMPEAVREREYAKAIGYLVAYTLSGVAIGAIGVLRGRGPEDDDPEAWARYWLHASTGQFTDAIPFVGEVITGLTGTIITGDNNSWMRLDRNMPAVDFLARSIEGMNAEDVDWFKVVRNATMGLGQMAGAPMKAIDEAVAFGRMLAGEE